MKKSWIQKSVSLILCLLLSLSAFALSAAAAEPNVKTVAYIDENGEPQTAQATVITPDQTTYGAAGETNWYVIEGEAESSNTIMTFDAVSNFILADNAAWTITNTSSFNIIGTAGSLNFFAQKNGSGSLTLSNRLFTDSGNVAIYGGTITTPAVQANMSSGTVFVYDGVIRTESFYSKDLLVAGGEVHTQTTNCKGTVTVSNGTVEALQPNSGYTALISEGDLVISGGEVTSSGAFGLRSNTGSVTITGGTVVAEGTSMGISGRAGISISGGTVTATGTNTMGLFSGGPITITGGTVNATGGIFGVYPNEEDGVVTLGADRPGSSYTFSSFLPGAAVSVKEGQTLTDGEADYSGELTDEQVAALAGKTLVCKHAWSWVIDSEAGCGEAGVKHEVCASCGATQNKNTVIPATGAHITNIVNAKEATATEDGYTGDEVCTVCGQTIKTGETIPATGEPTPDEPANEESRPAKGDFFSKLFAWLIELFRMFTRWVQK